MRGNKREIHDRIHKFVLLVLQLVKKIPRTTENLVLVKQLVRSATSIGANSLEADGSESKKEFIHRFSIAKREAKETLYWLQLIKETNVQLADVEVLEDEATQLIRIISKIIINTKKGI